MAAFRLRAGIVITCLIGLNALVGVPAIAQDKTAQTPPAPPAARPVTAATINARSPEVLPDGRVVFRLVAPRAAEVTIAGAGMRGPLTKDEATGIWSITTPPSVKPGIYTYHFVVDGVRIADPQTDDRKSPVESVVEIPLPPGTPPAPWQRQDVERGTLHVAWYHSKALGGVLRRVHIYTPPGYSPLRSTKYPVLYLLHGAGDDDSGWTTEGRANVILDNLIASGKARPMVVVMPEGHVPASASRSDRTKAFEADLMESLIPLIEGEYQVQTNRDGRALAGLSMGGAQTMHIGMADYPDKFGYLAVWSAGLPSAAGVRDGAASEEFARLFPRLTAEDSSKNTKPYLVHLSVGFTDGPVLFAAGKRLSDWLQGQNVTHEWHPFGGGHDWNEWRSALIDFAPQLFKD